MRRNYNKFLFIVFSSIVLIDLGRAVTKYCDIDIAYKYNLLIKYLIG